MRMRDQSVKRRLVLLTLVSSSAGLLLAFCLFAAYDRHLVRERKVEELRSAAELIARNSTAAVIFDDGAEAERILWALEMRVHIRQGVVFREDGSVLAKYVRGGLPAQPGNVRPIKAETLKWTNTGLELWRPIIRHGAFIGTLYLESTLEDLHEERKAVAVFGIPVFLVTLLLITGLTLLLQKSITEPVLALAHLARRVKNEKSYSLRATAEDQSELGQLAADFNHMLEAMEQREIELQQSRDLLEERVSERTMALEQEIAERQKTEQLLKEREELFRALNEAAPIGIVSATPEGIILQNNPAFQEMFGFQAEELAGKTVYELIPGGQKSEEGAALSGLMLEGRVFRRVVRNKKKDNTLLDVEIFGAPLRVERRRIGQLAIYLDISRRLEAEKAIRESEEWFRTLSLAVPIGIIRADREGRCVYHNQKVLEITGLTAEQAMEGGWLQAIHPDEREQTVRLWAAAVKMGMELDDEFQVLMPDGNINWIHFRSRLLHAEDGTVTGFVGVMEDITKRRATEHRMLEAKRAAEAANIAKSQFLANISHEIRTPMNGILGMTDLALGTPLNGEQKEYLGLVKNCAESLMEVIEGVLDFSKIESGKMELESIPFSILECAENALQAVAVWAKKKELTLEWWVRGELPEQVIGDPTRLRQVLINLLGNAVKFTEKGQVTLGVNCLTCGDERAEVQFLVSDTGVGVAPEHRDKIFEPFQQSDSSVTREFGGTGLGLSISSQLVKSMGGSIELESETGKGSCFHFTLTLERRRGESAISAETSGEFREFRNVRILVVENDEHRRKLLDWLLARWGLQADVASSLESAKESIARATRDHRPYRVAIVEDPEKGGREALLNELATEAGTKVILISTSSIARKGTRGETGNAVCQLTRPFRSKTLRECLRMALHDDKPEVVDKDAPRPSTAHTILLTEDNAVNQRLAMLLLAKMGHQVDLAANGVEAVNMFRARRYDLVLMDLQMPLMGGLEAAAKIREMESLTGEHTPILAMTAHAAVQDEQRCLDAGMDGYLTKPIHEELLGKEIERVIMKNTSRVQQALPETANWNVQELLERLDNDRAFLNELLTIFRQDGIHGIENAKKALADHDLPALARHAHTLKGMMRNLLMNGAARVASDLERAAQRSDAMEAGSAMKKLELAMGQLMVEVEAQVAEVKV
jgi:two-component system, sensor histidine kinase and response regulator